MVTWGVALSLPLAVAAAGPAALLPSAAAKPRCEASSQLDGVIGVPGEAIGKIALSGFE